MRAVRSAVVMVVMVVVVVVVDYSCTGSPSSRTEVCEVYDLL